MQRVLARHLTRADVYTVFLFLRLFRKNITGSNHRENFIFLQAGALEFTKYFYDDSNRPIKRELYDHNRTLATYIEKIYHGTSKLPDEERHYHSDGTLMTLPEF